MIEQIIKNNCRGENRGYEMAGNQVNKIKSNYLFLVNISATYIKNQRLR